MNLKIAAVLIVIYACGLCGSIAWATSDGASYLLGLLLWTSFFGFSTAVSLALFWSREEWFG